MSYLTCWSWVVWRTQLEPLTAILRWKRPISSDLGSKAASGLVSTWMGDRLGIPGAVSILAAVSLTLHKQQNLWTSVIVLGLRLLGEENYDTMWLKWWLLLHHRVFTCCLKAVKSWKASQKKCFTELYATNNSQVTFCCFDLFLLKTGRARQQLK